MRYTWMKIPKIKLITIIFVSYEQKTKNWWWNIMLLTCMSFLLTSWVPWPILQTRSVASNSNGNGSHNTIHKDSCKSHTNLGFKMENYLYFTVFLFILLNIFQLHFNLVWAPGNVIDCVSNPFRLGILKGNLFSPHLIHLHLSTSIVIGLYYNHDSMHNVICLFIECLVFCFFIECISYSQNSPHKCVYIDMHIHLFLNRACIINQSKCTY